MLANVKRLQMKTIRAHFKQQRINQRMGQPRAAVLHQAGMHNLQIIEELLRRLVSR